MTGWHFRDDAYIEGAVWLYQGHHERLDLGADDVAELRALFAPDLPRLRRQAELGRVARSTIADAWSEEDCIHKRVGLGWDSCDHPLGLLLQRIHKAQWDYLSQTKRIAEIREAREE